MCVCVCVCVSCYTVCGRESVPVQRFAGVVFPLWPAERCIQLSLQEATGELSPSSSSVHRAMELRTRVAEISHVHGAVCA